MMSLWEMTWGSPFQKEKWNVSSTKSLMKLNFPHFFVTRSTHSLRSFVVSFALRAHSIVRPLIHSRSTHSVASLLRSSPRSLRSRDLSWEKCEDLLTRSTSLYPSSSLWNDSLLSFHISINRKESCKQHGLFTSAWKGSSYNGIMKIPPSGVNKAGRG